MLRWGTGLIALALLAGLPGPTEAAGPGAYARRVSIKSTHAVADIVYSPMELLLNPVTHAVDFDRHNRSGGHGLWVGGLVGIVKMGTRFGRGVADLLTFPFPSERHDHWSWDWSFLGFQYPLTEPTPVEDAAY